MVRLLFFKNWALKIAKFYVAARSNASGTQVGRSTTLIATSNEQIVHPFSLSSNFAFKLNKQAVNNINTSRLLIKTHKRKTRSGWVDTV